MILRLINFEEEEEEEDDDDDDYDDKYRALHNVLRDYKNL
jgi:hypothetical protein